MDQNFPAKPGAEFVTEIADNCVGYSNHAA